MKPEKILLQYAKHLKFSNQFSNIPINLFEETYQSEIIAAEKNSNLYWDHFEVNLRRSNVLKARVEKQCRGAQENAS